MRKSSRKSKLEQRIEALEREVEALKVRPPIAYHYHYDTPSVGPTLPPFDTGSPPDPFPLPYIPALPQTTAPGVAIGTTSKPLFGFPYSYD